MLSGPGNVTTASHFMGSIVFAPTVYPDRVFPYYQHRLSALNRFNVLTVVFFVSCVNYFMNLNVFANFVYIRNLR